MIVRMSGKIIRSGWEKRVVKFAILIIQRWRQGYQIPLAFL